MKRSLLALLLASGALLACMPAFAADPAPVVVRLPAVTVPVPVPVSGPTPLSAGQLYVIDADVACVVLVSPAGILKVSADTGPEKMRGLFVDGNAIETRTFKGKFLYLIEATGTAGKVEVIVVPSGATGEGDVIRRCLVVGSVPTPVPPVPPVPPAPADPLTATFQSAYASAPDPKALAFLQTVYGGLATAFETTPLPPQLGAITSYAQAAALLKTVVEAPGLGLTPTQVMPLRKAIAAELAKTLTGSYSQIATANALSKVATALQGIK